MYIDSHAHLYLEQFKDDQDEIIQRCLDNDVQKIFLPNIDSTTTKRMLDLCHSFPEVCYPMIGLHPCSVKENLNDELSHIEDELKINKYYGIGESGIDLYWDKTFKKDQIKAFEFQIDLASRLDLPIIIHSRESLDLTIDIITNHQTGHLKGIFHCFNGNVSQCKKILDVNFQMGLGGVITFKNAKLDEMINYLPFTNMLLETDAPYLSPAPYRGKRNESSYIPLIAKKVSEIKNVKIEDVMNFTTKNAKEIFCV